MQPFRAAILLVLLALPACTSLQAAGTGETGWSPPEDARDRLEKILEDPVFQLEEPEPGLTQEIMGKVREFLFGLFSRISSAMALNAALVTVLLWTVIVLALMGAGWLIIRLTRDRISSTTGYSPAERQPAAVPEPVRSPEELLAMAREALVSGNGRRVLPPCLQAAIQALRRAGHLPDDRSMTDLEGTRVLERTGPLTIRKPFRTLAQSHDRLVYAGLPAGGEELNQALSLAERIVDCDPAMTEPGADR